MKISKKAVGPAYPDGQRIEHGGKFKSKKQRKFLWAVMPKAAEKWAHNLKTTKGDWKHIKPKHASTKLKK